MFAPIGSRSRRSCGSAARPRIVKPTSAPAGSRPPPPSTGRDGRTRGVIVNSPSNPSGAVNRVRRLARIPGLCDARDAVLIFDEPTNHFLYGGRRHVSAAPSRRCTRAVSS